MTDIKPTIKMERISKDFPGVKALEDVNLELLPGEVHCLIGENGAGKSTLIKILTGALTMTSGQILLDGRPVEIGNPQNGRALGIRAIYQELDLLPTLTVAENIFVEGRPTTRTGLIDWAEMNRRAQELLGRFSVRIDARAKVRTLTVAEQQIVAIAKALSQDSRVLIMDEPSAVLTGGELERLFGIIRQLKQQGVAIVYITHRLVEAFEIGDRVTVLRDGKHVVTADIQSVNLEQLIKWMVGREIHEQFFKENVAIGPMVLECERLSVAGKIRDISFQLREGEILGIAGLVGAGRTELLKTLFGVFRPDSGSLTVHSKPCNFVSPRAAIRLGLGLVPEDRKREGVVLCRSIEENVSVGVLVRRAFRFIIKFPMLYAIVARLANYVGIKCYSLQQEVGTLSGGNQQKTVLAKWLASESRILLLDEPTRGIDVGSKLEFYKLMAAMVRERKSIILVSSELPELMALSDRILVMSNGQIRKEFAAGEASQEDILRYAIPQELRLSPTAG